LGLSSTNFILNPLLSIFAASDKFRDCSIKASGMKYVAEKVNHEV